MRKAVASVLVGIAASFPTSAQNIPRAEWTVGCEVRGKDQFGDKQRQYCFVMVHNSGLPQYNPDYSWRLSGKTIIEIDASGEQVMPPIKTRHCQKGPQRMAVDQRRIDNLKRQEQVAALENGAFFVIERQHHTNCNIAPYGTNLSGFNAALNEMRGKWKAISRR